MTGNPDQNGTNGSRPPGSSTPYPLEVADWLGSAPAEQTMAFFAAETAGEISAADYESGTWLDRVQGHLVVTPHAQTDSEESAEIAGHTAWKDYSHPGDPFAAMDPTTLRAMRELGTIEIIVYSFARMNAWRGGPHKTLKPGQVIVGLADLARQSCMTFPAVRRTVDRLVDKGWIRREPSQTKRKKYDYFVRMPV